MNKLFVWVNRNLPDRFSMWIAWHFRDGWRSAIPRHHHIMTYNVHGETHKTWFGWFGRRFRYRRWEDKYQWGRETK
jgi:hypothetical protein